MFIRLARHLKNFQQFSHLCCSSSVRNFGTKSIKMPLPEGWKESPDMALGLVEGIFFPFKTPLSADNGSFSIKTVVDHAKEQKWVIGLWIDLTNTTKYYNPMYVERLGIKYFKLAVVGRESPTRKDISFFVTVCNNFLTENPTQKIGIHCTHGFNRTGFLICSFLSATMKMDPHVALEKFAEQRPPGIYRQNMVDDFVRYFGGWRSNAPPKVSSPPWKVGNTRKIRQGNAVPVPSINTHNVGGNIRVLPHQEINRIRIPKVGESFQKYLTYHSIDVAEAKQQSMFSEINALLGRGESCRFHHSVRALDEIGFNLIKSQRYMVSWRPQEYFRYTLFLNSKGEAFLIDEKNRVKELPSLRYFGSSKSDIFSTLIFGMVLRRATNSEHGSVGEYLYDMSDVLVFNGRDLQQCSLGERLKCLREQILGLRKLGRSHINIPHHMQDPFRLQVQPMWPLSQFRRLQTYEWSNFYSVGPNGLIFYPANNTEETSTVLEWIPPNTESIFLRLSKDCSETTLKYLVFTDDEPNAAVDELKQLSKDDNSTLSSLVGQVVECHCAEKYVKFKRESQRRIITDASAFVNDVISGDCCKNIDMKTLFGYLNSLKEVGTPRKRPGLSTSVLSNTSGIDSEFEALNIKA